MPDFELTIRTEAELAALKETQRELRDLVAAERATGGAATELYARLVKVNAAISAAPATISAYERELRSLTTTTGAAERQTRGFGQSLSGALDTFKGSFAGGLATGAVQAVGQELQALARNAIDLADRLDDLSAKSGVSAEAIQRIGNAASQDGGTLEQTASILLKLSRSASEAAEKTDGPLAQAFRDLGIRTGELTTLGPDALFLRIADGVSTASDRGGAFADVATVMGRESKELFATIERGSHNIIKLSESMGVLTDATVTRLASAKEALEQLQNRVTVFAGESLGAFTKFSEQLDVRLLPALAQISPAGGAAVGALKALMSGTEDVGKAAKKTAPEVREMTDEMKEAVAKIDDFFKKRDFEKLPLEKQALATTKAIKDLRAEIAKELPAVTVKDASALNQIADGIGSPEQRAKVKGQAIELAKLEDQLGKVGDAQKKAGDAGKKAGDDTAKAFKGAAKEITSVQEALDYLAAVEATRPSRFENNEPEVNRAFQKQLQELSTIYNQQVAKKSGLPGAPGPGQPAPGAPGSLSGIPALEAGTGPQRTPAEIAAFKARLKERETFIPPTPVPGIATEQFQATLDRRAQPPAPPPGQVTGGLSGAAEALDTAAQTTQSDAAPALIAAATKLTDAATQTQDTATATLQPGAERLGELPAAFEGIALTMTTGVDAVQKQLGPTQTAIDGYFGTVQGGFESLATATQSADAALQRQIDTLAAQIANLR